MRLFLALALLGASSAHAEAPYGMAGCGLGSIVMGNKGGQISAATTNSTFWSQPAGITSGTSNCLEPSEFTAVEAQKTFFADNLEPLSVEMAQGQGRYLNTFADTLGCSVDVRPVLAATLKDSYADIFAQPGAMATLSYIKAHAKKQPELNKNCKYLIQG
jgi:hypothetical protein